MIYTGIIYEDGKYWVYHDGKGFVICRNKGACSEVIGFAGTFEQAKEELQRILRDD